MFKPLSQVPVTLLVSLGAVLIVAAQFQYTWHPDVRFGPYPEDLYIKLSLWKMNQRGAELASLTDPIEREEHCLRTSAFARRLDDRVPKDARFFVAGVLGENHAAENSTYFFLRNYLFPRLVEISLDGHAVQTLDGYAGVSTDSQDELRAHGFDVLVQIDSKKEAGIFFLTEKGVPK